MNSNPKTFFHPGTRDGEALQLWVVEKHSLDINPAAHVNILNLSTMREGVQYPGWQRCHVTLYSGRNTFLEHPAELGLGVLAGSTVT